MKSSVAAFSGEHRPLACWFWRLAKTDFSLATRFRSAMRIEKVRDGGPPSPTGQRPVLPGVLGATFLLLTTALFMTWLSLPKLPLLDGIRFSRRVFDRNGKLLCVTLSDDQKYRIFTPIERISPELINAT